VPDIKELFFGEKTRERQLICTMGLPRSGKSTVARFLSKHLGAPVVNRDSIRLAMHGQRFAAAAEPLVKATATIMVKSLFAYHDIVIVDETNLNYQTRDYWSDVGHSDGKVRHVEFLDIATPEELCIARARSLGDEQLIPVIERMAMYDDRLDYAHAWVLVNNGELKDLIMKAETERPEKETANAESGQD